MQPPPLGPLPRRSSLFVLCRRLYDPSYVSKHTRPFHIIHALGPFGVFREMEKREKKKKNPSEKTVAGVFIEVGRGRI